MNSESSGDVAFIDDEDVLRRMWQNTEDFGRKKEIRAHMYKLREARLKDLYSNASNDNSSAQHAKKITSSSKEQLQRVENISETVQQQNVTQKNNRQGSMIHAESLKDQSFMSLKSKEIRDSESPTRELYGSTSWKDGPEDHKWQVSQSVERSVDGKMEKSVCSAEAQQMFENKKSDLRGVVSASLKEESIIHKDETDSNLYTSSISTTREHTETGNPKSQFQATQTTQTSSTTKKIYSTSPGNDDNIQHSQEEVHHHYSSSSFSTSSSKIHVETHNPTHEAFARSLRAVSPNRERSVSPNVRRISNSSLRSSVSPDKLSNRCSPISTDRKMSPRKSSSPDTKFSSSENVIRGGSKNSRRSISPEKYFGNLETSNKYKSTFTETEARKKFVTEVTDLDDQVETHNDSTNVNLNNETSFSTAAKISSRKITNKCSTNPIPRRDSNSPVKSTLDRKPFKRSDTYEERCKQILGISSSPITKVDETKKQRSLHRNYSSPLFTRNSFNGRVEDLDATKVTKVPLNARRQEKSVTQHEILKKSPERGSRSKPTETNIVTLEVNITNESPLMLSESIGLDPSKSSMSDAKNKNGFSGCFIETEHEELVKEYQRGNPEKTKKAFDTLEKSFEEVNVDEYANADNSEEKNKVEVINNIRVDTEIEKTPEKTTDSKTCLAEITISSDKLIRTENEDRLEKNLYGNIATKNVKEDTVKVKEYTDNYRKRQNSPDTKTVQEANIKHRASPEKFIKDKEINKSVVEIQDKRVSQETFLSRKSAEKNIKPIQDDTIKKGISRKTTPDLYKRSVSPEKVILETTSIIKTETIKTNKKKDSVSKKSPSASPDRKSCIPNRRSVDKFYSVPTSVSPPKEQVIQTSENKLRSFSPERKPANSDSRKSPAKVSLPVVDVMKGTTLTVELIPSITVNTERVETDLKVSTALKKKSPSDIVTKKHQERSPNVDLKSEKPTSSTRIVTKTDSKTIKISSSAPNKRDQALSPPQHTKPKPTKKTVKTELTTNINTPVVDETLATTKIKPIQGKQPSSSNLVPVNEPVVTVKLYSPLYDCSNKDKRIKSTTVSKPTNVKNVTTTATHHVGKKDSVDKHPMYGVTCDKVVKTTTATTTKREPMVKKTHITNASKTIFGKHKVADVVVNEDESPKCCATKYRTQATKTVVGKPNSNQKPTHKVSTVIELVPNKTTSSLKNKTTNVSSSNIKTARDTTAKKAVPNVCRAEKTKASHQQTKENDSTDYSKIQRKEINETIVVTKEDAINANKSLPSVDAVDFEKTNAASQQIKESDSINAGNKMQRNITTKTIIVNNDIDNVNLTNAIFEDGLNKEELKTVFVDIQRSVSSREPTPDRICPMPVTPQEELYSESSPRYPDEICEPEDVKTHFRKNLTRLVSEPILEGSTIPFHRLITDVTDQLEDVSEELNITSTKGQTTVLDQEDECLLSVHDKVSHFLNAAEKSTKTVTSASVQQEPVLKSRIVNVADKVNMFLEAAEKITSGNDVPKTLTKNVSISDIGIEEPVCTKPVDIQLNQPERIRTADFNSELRSVETVRKARAMFENIGKAEKQENTETRSFVNLKRKPQESQDIKQNETFPQIERAVRDKTVLRTSPEKQTPVTLNTVVKDKQILETQPDSNDDTACVKQQLNMSAVVKEKVGVMETVKSPAMKKSPIKEQKRYSSPIKDVKEVKEKVVQSKTVTSSRRSVSPQKEVLSPKAFSERAVFDDSASTSVKSDRPSPAKESSEIKSQRPSDEVPSYQRPLQRNNVVAENYMKTVRKQTHTTTTKSPTREILQKRDKEIKEPTKDDTKTSPSTTTHSEKMERYKTKSRECSRTSLKEKSPSPGKVMPSLQLDEAMKPTKFGVSLRRTSSACSSSSVITSSTLERRRSSAGVTTPDEVCIESITDLKVLEDMMSKVVGYEQRRRVRSQIREVKRLINESSRSGTEKKVISTVTKTVTSPFVKDNKTSPTSTATKQQKPHRPEIDKLDIVNNEIQSTTTTKTHKETYVSDDVSNEGGGDRKSTTVVTTKIVEENKPSWVTQRNLRKVDLTKPPATVVSKKVSTISSTTTSSNSSKMETFKVEEPNTMDCITSSYGVGPIDENGRPLFGIRALKAKKKGKFAVEGTVIESNFYSETGKEPVGSVSVTRYSSDPKDFKDDSMVISSNEQEGDILSVTNVQHFGDSQRRRSSDRQSNEDDEAIGSAVNLQRRGSVKALTRKFIVNASETSNTEKQPVYPKAGLILRTSSFKEPSNVEKVSRVDTFLNSSSKIEGVQDLLMKMRNADQDIQAGDTAEDREGRALLNKFLGAQILLSSIEQSNILGSNVTGTASTTTSTNIRKTILGKHEKQQSASSSTIQRFQQPITADTLDNIWDEQTLRVLLEESTNYEERKLIRARLRQVMAEQDVCAELVVNASKEAQESGSVLDQEEDGASAVVTTSVKEEHVQGTTTNKSGGEVQSKVTSKTMVSRVTSQQVSNIKKPMSPFAKFRQLDKQNSTSTPPSTPKSPSGAGANPFFKFTDPSLACGASTVKERLLQWCQMKTKEYENVQLDNFSSSWADGLAFCALIHHFLPDTFDYHTLTAKERRRNFTLAFTVADEKAGIAPLLDVDDMVAMRRPDWKCVFTYVQSIYRRFKDED